MSTSKVFEHRLKQFKAFLIKHKRLPKYSNDSEKVLYRWMYNWKYKSNEVNELLSRYQSLSKSSDLRSKDLPKGFRSSDLVRISFDTRLKEFEEFVKTYGRLPKYSENKQLLNWYKGHSTVSQVKDIYNKYRARKRRAKLEYTNMLHQLIDYVREFNKLPSRSNEDTRVLGRWVDTHSKDPVVSKIRDLYIFNARRVDRTDELREFCETHRRLPTSTECKSLYDWMKSNLDIPEVEEIHDKYIQFNRCLVRLINWINEHECLPKFQSWNDPLKVDKEMKLNYEFMIHHQDVPEIKELINKYNYADTINE